MVYVWSRLLIVGGDHLRLHEELTYSGGELKADTYRREPLVGRLQKLLEESHPVDEVPESVFNVLKSRFEKYENAVINTYEARSRERLENLLVTLERREKSEIKDVNDLLDELEKNIRAELSIEDDTERYTQLTFDFAEEDMQELKRDFAALRARLDQIPAEREEEMKLIEKHYSSPRTLTFPAGVMFLIPENKTWGCM
jgi:chromosome segregation ATPase